MQTHFVLNFSMKRYAPFHFIFQSHSAQHQLRMSVRLHKLKRPHDLISEQVSCNDRSEDDRVSDVSRISSLFVFVIVFYLYCAAAPRTISGGDAGELAAAACTLSVPHPPGQRSHRTSNLCAVASQASTAQTHTVSHQNAQVIQASFYFTTLP